MVQLSAALILKKSPVDPQLLIAAINAAVIVVD